MHEVARFFVELYLIVKGTLMILAFGFIALAVGIVLWDDLSRRWRERREANKYGESTHE